MAPGASLSACQKTALAKLSNHFNFICDFISKRQSSTNVQQLRKDVLGLIETRRLLTTKEVRSLGLDRPGPKKAKYFVLGTTPSLSDNGPTQKV